LMVAATSVWRIALVEAKKYVVLEIAVFCHLRDSRWPRYALGR
jgi:hypothetical protein